MRLDALRKLWTRLRAGGDVERNLNSDSFTDSELAVGRMILPLLDDLAAAQKVIEELTKRTRALEVVLRLLPVAAIVVDRQGRLLSANGAAKTLFHGPAMPERVIASAVRTLSATGEANGALLQNADGSGLDLRLVPADVGEPVEGDGEAPAVVFLVPTDRPAVVDSAALSRRFALTPAQTKVVALLCCGMTNREIAAELRLSIETVRKHVATIFDKTAVNTRSALVALAYGARYGQTRGAPGSEMSNPNG
jgi:DNA-binding CsgD family transcriptional regulator